MCVCVLCAVEGEDDHSLALETVVDGAKTG